jgi:hypothetical protein
MEDLEKKPISAGIATKLDRTSGSVELNLFLKDVSWKEKDEIGYDPIGHDTSDEFCFYYGEWRGESVIIRESLQSQSRDEFLREVAVFFRLSCFSEHVPRILGAAGHGCVVMEKVSRGSNLAAFIEKNRGQAFSLGMQEDHIKSLLDKQKQPKISQSSHTTTTTISLSKIDEAKLSVALPWDVCGRLALGVSTGLADLHALGVPHGSLSSDKVLLIKSCPKLTGIDPTPLRDPEKFRERVNNDIHSLGVILWELATGYKSYKEIETSSKKTRIPLSREELDVALEKSSCPQEFKELIKQCWTFKRRKRPISKPTVSQTIASSEAKVEVREIEKKPQPQPAVPEAVSVSDKKVELCEEPKELQLQPGLNEKESEKKPGEKVFLLQGEINAADLEQLEKDFRGEKFFREGIRYSQRRDKSQEQALACFRQAAGEGHLLAQGYLHEQRREYDEAIQCYLQAKELGHPTAYTYLGDLCRKSETGKIKGLKWSKHYSVLTHQWTEDGYIRLTARDWYQRGAEAGDARAQYKLALYCYGSGYQTLAKQKEQPEQTIAEWHQESAVEAVKWCWYAAAQGHPDAQYQLGIWLRDGVGVGKNKGKAAEWLKKGLEGRGHSNPDEEISKLLRDPSKPEPVPVSLSAAAPPPLVPLPKPTPPVVAQQPAKKKEKNEQEEEFQFYEKPTISAAQVVARLQILLGQQPSSAVEKLSASFPQPSAESDIVLNTSSTKPGQVVLNFNLSGLSLGRQLGKGGCGQVCEARWGGKQLAVKTLNPLRIGAEKYNKMLLDEGVFLLNAGGLSDRIVKLYGLSVGEVPKIVMELMSEGDLCHLLQHHARYETRLSPVTTRQLVEDICQGVRDLHALGLLHRDLKSLNALLHKVNGQLRLKISDLGLAIAVRDAKESHCGTRGWRAPEVERGEPVTEKSDIYSMGVLLWELFTYAKPPAPKADDKAPSLFKEALDKLAENECPRKFKELILQCLSEQPERRPTAKEVVGQVEKIVKIVEQVDDTVKKYIVKTQNPQWTTDVSIVAPGKEEFKKAVVLWEQGKYSLAWPVFQQAVQQGYLPANLYLEDMQAHGQVKETHEWKPTQPSVRDGFLVRKDSYDVEKLFHCGWYLFVKNGDIAEVEEYWRLAWKWGYVAAYDRLGNLYQKRGDHKAAVKCYRLAAELGHVTAQFELAVSYGSGVGHHQQDYSQARKWLQAAAEHGHGEAAYRLAIMDRDGIGLAKPDIKKALHWMRHAAKQEHVEAQYQLALLYRSLGVAKKEKSLRWLHKAADQKHPQAQFELGKRYYEGNEVSQDYVKAAQYLPAAVKSLYPDLQQCDAAVLYYVGRLYSGDGDLGTPPNLPEAYTFFVAAAKQNHRAAQGELAECYERGHGIPQDSARADYWRGRSKGIIADDSPFSRPKGSPSSSTSSLSRLSLGSRSESKLSLPSSPSGEGENLLNGGAVSFFGRRSPDLPPTLEEASILQRSSNVQPMAEGVTLEEHEGREVGVSKVPGS